MILQDIMQLQRIPAFLIILLVVRFISGHTMVRENRVIDDGLDERQGGDRDRKGPESKVLDMESIFAGFAKSVISRTGGTSSQVPTYRITILIILTYYNLGFLFYN